MANAKDRELVLCPHHTQSLRWADCTVGFKGCKVEEARARGWVRAKRFTIPADIQALKVSRQRKLQLTYRRKGLCPKCGKEPAVKPDGSPMVYCAYHVVYNRERNKTESRNLGAASYTVEDNLNTKDANSGK